MFLYIDLHEVLLLFKIEDGRHLVSWDILDFSRTTACHVTRIDGHACLEVPECFPVHWLTKITRTNACQVSRIDRHAPLEVLEGFPGHWLTKISRTTAFQVTRIDRHAPLEVPEGFPGHWLAKISRTTACHVTEIDRHVPLEVPEGFPGHWLTKISRTSACQVTRLVTNVPLYWSSWSVVISWTVPKIWQPWFLNLISTFLLLSVYRWVDTSAGGLVVPEGIIHQVVRASTMTWFIRYIYYWNLQFLNNVIIYKAMVHLPQV